MVFNGISTVRLKCGESRGRQPSITVLRYALKALVVSFRRMRNIMRDEQVREAIHAQLDPGIIDDAAASQEA